MSLAGAPAAELLTLESEALRVRLWPRMGGKIVSIVVRGHGKLAGNLDRELLHPAIHPYNEATRSSGFQDSDAGGWDECLPSVAGCHWKGVDIPDHGDVWRTPWTAVIRNDALLAHTQAFSLPLRFSRRIALDGPTMHLNYAVTNTGTSAADFLWSAHPLFQVQEGDRIVLPDDTDTVHVEGSTVSALLRNEPWCPWPHVHLAHGGHLDLSTVGPQDGHTSHKLFAGPLATGWCGLYRTQLQLGIVMRFDPTHTPFAGLWISQGAWPPGEIGAKQYTVALEPTTAPCDALDRAAGHGHAQHLLPQAEFAWPLQFEVYGSHEPVFYEDFLALASIPPRH